MSKYYKHYKNKPYKLLGTVRHSETLEEMALYETLYENSKGKLWVRPKEMFFEDVMVNGKTVPRFAQVPVTVKSFDSIGPAEKELVKSLTTEIFGRFDEEGFDSTLKNKTNFLLLIAAVENKPAGFKLGYQHDKETFYSWLGGVLPEMRGLGLAEVLMKSQHDWCKNCGLKKVQTKTKNKWRNMIILNLKNGFEIIGTYTDDKGEAKLILEKTL